MRSDPPGSHRPPELEGRHTGLADPPHVADVSALPDRDEHRDVLRRELTGHGLDLPVDASRRLVELSALKSPFRGFSPWNCLSI